MRTFGLIGYPLGHSYSKVFFDQKFSVEELKDVEYRLFPIKTIHELPQIITTTPTLAGLNVTIPYKEEIIPYLDHLDESAEAAGAVNTIKIVDGYLVGYNTDVFGFRKSLFPLLLPLHRKALVLGTGGASKAVEVVLKDLGIVYKKVGRKKAPGVITYDKITPEIIEEHLLIINTTPLGMSPDVATFPPIPYENLSYNHLLFDLVYNPEKTAFLEKGEAAGAEIKNGLEMLYLQAEAAWAVWNKQEG